MVTEEASAWFKNERHINPETLSLLPVASGTLSHRSAVYFKYREGWKARTFPAKDFRAGGGFKPQFWNLDAVLEAKPDTVWITEGEIDSIALVEAGISSYQVLSVPNGARQKPKNDPESSPGYEYVINALQEGLGAVKRFVWCGDADEPGKALQADFVRLLGAARFYYVTWPEGIKDPNEMLVKDGAVALRELVLHGALPWPQAGLFRLSELPTPPALTIWKPTIPGLDGKIHFAPRTLSVVTGHPGHGKQAPVDSIILTPSGWVQFGSLKVGDFVIGRNGRPVKVSGIYPQGYKQAYRIIFRDGSSTECGEEHLWTVAPGNKRKKWVTLPLKDIVARGLRRVTKDKTRKSAKWRIPLCEPIAFKAKDFPINPYILGLLLGDGYINKLCISNPDFDSDIRNFASERLSLSGCWIKEDYSSNCPRFYIRGDGRQKIKKAIDTYGLNVKSGKKFIPPDYLLGSIEQRIELLRGLMDTDGGCIKNRTCFYSTSKVLRDQVIDLVRSLGGVAIARQVDRSAEGKTTEYIANVKIGICPFYTQRKASQWRPQNPSRYIWDVQPSRMVEQMCISVEADDGLYLTNDYIVTHNTMLFSQLWQGIVSTYNLTCCIASFETRPKPHIRRQLRTLLSGKLEYEMTEAECAQADAWIEDHYLFLMHPDHKPSLEWFLECAETAVIRHGAKIIQLDPWNRLEAARGPREPETDYILRCLRELYVFANDMDCHVQIVAHPAKMDSGRRGSAPVLEDIMGSKHWDNVVDQGFTVHRPQMFDGAERRTETTLFHRKARFEELGYPCKIMLNYDLLKRRYVPLSEGLTADDF